VALEPTHDGRTRPPGREAGGFLLVALSAALWGTDALFRRGLALELPAATVVFGEHLILVLADLGGSDLLALLLLALVPGLLALLLYYRGLRGTPAAAATLAELAFPNSPSP
jgi:drug/metabolite transporter (DMT)-like permease